MVLGARNKETVTEVEAEKILLSRFKDGYYLEITDWFFNYVPQDFTPTKILDVGCGTGHLLQFCQRKLGANAATFSGVDINKHMIVGAEKTFPSYQFEVVEGSQLPYPDNSFDFVYIATVLSHAPNPFDILKEAIRVTTNGGKVAVLDQDFETAVLYLGEKQLTRKVLNAAADYWSDGWLARKSPSLFKKLGLMDIQIDASVRIGRF